MRVSRKKVPFADIAVILESLQEQDMMLDMIETALDYARKHRLDDKVKFLINLHNNVLNPPKD